MWDGHIGRLSIAKRRIELASHDTQQTYCEPYIKRPVASDFERTEID